VSARLAVQKYLYLYDTLDWFTSRYKLFSATIASLLHLRKMFLYQVINFNENIPVLVLG
jgi:hypothetical protein